MTNNLAMTNNQNELREKLLSLGHKYEDPEFMTIHGKCDMEVAAPRCAKRVKDYEKLITQAVAAAEKAARIDENRLVVDEIRKGDSDYVSVRYHERRIEELHQTSGEPSDES